MVYERFFEGDMPHSLLGFGAMRLPTLPDGSIDEEQSLAMIRLALDSGVNYFDTAYVYHDGCSEGFLRRALADYPRERYMLADKLPLWQVETPQDAERIFNEQLERCGVSYFDCYLVHALDRKHVETMRRLNTVQFLYKMRDQGKIRRLGFSFHDDLDCFKDIMTLCHWDFCQLQLNYADWNRFDASSLHALAVSYRLPIIVMEPVRGGFLAQPPEPVATLLREGIPTHSAASMALRFTATLPGVKLVLSGMSSLSQLRDNLITFSYPGVYLSTPEQELLRKATAMLDELQTIPCTGCRYCMPCPAGVDIPACLRAYNNATFLGSGNGGYSDLAAQSRAEHCVQCGQCTERCPQHIDIPVQLADLHEKLNRT